MAERTVYILLTRSGTWFSRLIHLATQDSYTHASIGLDGPDGPFYSFARKHPHLALPAGLVEEAPAAERGAEMPCRLYELKVSEDVYRRLRRRLACMYGQRERYHYNLLGWPWLLRQPASPAAAPLLLLPVRGRTAGGMRRGHPGQKPRPHPPRRPVRVGGLRAVA